MYRNVCLLSNSIPSAHNVKACRRNRDRRRIGSIRRRDPNEGGPIRGLASCEEDYRFATIKTGIMI